MDAPADPRIAQLSEMADAAYRLGMAFAKEAEAAETRQERIELFKLFDRCFFCVRVATALELRLARASVTASARAVPADRDDGDEAPDWEETPDWEERAELYEERDRERDRETERASLPVLLRTLESVVQDAEARRGPKPAALITLRELLDQVKSKPAPVTAAPALAQGLRARLASSGATATVTLSRSAMPRSQASTPPPRATGPPKPK